MRRAWRCHACGLIVTRGYRTIERHVDETHGGGRIECIEVEEPR